MALLPMSCGGRAQYRAYSSPTRVGALGQISIDKTKSKQGYMLTSPPSWSANIG